jgi:hypothetical protein
VWLEEIVKFEQGYLGEGRDGEVGVGEGIDGVGGGDGDGFHTGGESGFDADVGVFEDDATGGVAIYFPGGDEEDFGVGFAAGDIFGGGDGVEEVIEAGEADYALDIFAGGGGADGAGDVVLLEGG